MLRPYQKSLVAGGILVIWIVALNWGFSHFARTSYFYWYLKNGTLVSIATAFGAVVWGKLEEEQKDLLSANPSIFIRTCAVIAGIFLMELGTLIKPSGTKETNSGDLVSVLAGLLEAFSAPWRR